MRFPVPESPDRARSRAESELFLAHELVHQAQRAGDASESVGRALGPDWTTDRVYVAWALVEGGAEHVENVYGRQYLDGANADRDYRPDYLDASDGERTFLGYYSFGARYVADRTDSPDDLWAVYRNPPRTTEQLLHGHAPDEELPSDLSVSVGGSSARYVFDRNTMGEYFLRVLLAGELPEERAAAAAAGWGNDSLVVLPEPEGGEVWLLRWDDAANATEFEAAMGAFLDARANRTGDGRTDGEVRFALSRPGDRTVALAVGNEAFHDGLTVEAEDGNVTVTSN